MAAIKPEFAERPWVETATILRAEVGSGVHGVATAGTDDRDEMAICIEPIDEAYGIGVPFEQHIYRTAAVREGKSDARSQPGDLDLTIYSLRKWLRLALHGNPSVIVLLFTPTVVLENATGYSLRHDMGPHFASRQAGKRFLGYLQGQRQKLLGERGQKNVNRPELVEKFGYDTKYAGHMLRLGYQGIEYMRTGRLTLPMAEPYRSRVLDVRQGRVSQADVVAETLGVEDTLKELQDSSPLPLVPNTAAVNEWMLDRYLEWWKAGWGHDRYLQTLKRMGRDDMIERYSL